MISADNIKVADSLRFVTPKGKIVYGGGGIIPDVFVPKDTSIENETLEYVTRNGFMSYFIFEFLEANREDFNGMTFKDLSDNYEVDEALTEDFISYARLEEAHIDISGYTRELNLALKANIAQQLFGPNAYEYLLNEGDPMIEKVFELEESNDPQ